MSASRCQRQNPVGFWRWPVSSSMRLTERRERLDTYDAERERRAIAPRIRAALIGRDPRR